MHRWGAGRAVGGDTRKRKLRLELFLFCFLLKYFFFLPLGSGTLFGKYQVQQLRWENWEITFLLLLSSLIVFHCRQGREIIWSKVLADERFFPSSSLYKLRTIGRSGSRKLRHGRCEPKQEFRNKYFRCTRTAAIFPPLSLSGHVHTDNKGKKKPLAHTHTHTKAK